MRDLVDIAKLTFPGQMNRCLSTVGIKDRRPQRIGHLLMKRQVSRGTLGRHFPGSGRPGDQGFLLKFSEKGCFGFSSHRDDGSNTARLPLASRPVDGKRCLERRPRPGNNRSRPLLDRGRIEDVHVVQPAWIDQGSNLQRAGDGGTVVMNADNAAETAKGSRLLGQVRGRLGQDQVTGLDQLRNSHGDN